MLLKNDGTLPLKSSVKNIAVVGPLADSLQALEGNYNGTPTRYTTLIDGIRKQFGAAKVTYTPGTSFLRNPVVVSETAFHGLTAAYFTNKDLSGAAVATRTEPQLGSVVAARGGGGGAGATRLPDGVGTGDFSVRYTGAITPPESAKYVIAINGNGGVRVWLDGKQIINDWTQRAPVGRGGVDSATAQARSAEVALDQGKNYDLKVEFFHDAAATAAAAAGRAGRGGFGAAPSLTPSLTWISCTPQPMPWPPPNRRTW